MTVAATLRVLVLRAEPSEGELGEDDRVSIYEVGQQQGLGCG